MDSSKALVSNFIFPLHMSSTHLLENHRMVGVWRNFWSFVSNQTFLASSRAPLLIGSPVTQVRNSPGGCQVKVTTRVQGLWIWGCFCLSKGALCTCTWSGGWQQMATAMSPMVLCSQNLSDGSSSSPRHRSMHSSCPHERQLYLLVVCACAFQRAHIHP